MERRVCARALVAYHEAGHAVLGAALGDGPGHVSILADDTTLGHTRQHMVGPPPCLAQICLAGFAAEHRLTGRYPRQLEREVGFAILSLEDQQLRAAFSEASHRDGHRAVQEVRRTALLRSRAEVQTEVARHYSAALASLSSIWPAVERVAEALLSRTQLDREQLFETIGGFDIYAPVLAVQRAQGLRHE